MELVSFVDSRNPLLYSEVEVTPQMSHRRPNGELLSNAT